VAICDKRKGGSSIYSQTVKGIIEDTRAEEYRPMKVVDRVFSLRDK